MQLSKNEDKQDINPMQYKRLIGSLRYLCNTRPDLEFSVGMVSRFLGKPKAPLLTSIKRILRYIIGSLVYKILFPERIRVKVANCSIIPIQTSVAIKMT